MPLTRILGIVQDIVFLLTLHADLITLQHIIASFPLRSHNSTLSTSIWFLQCMLFYLFICDKQFSANIFACFTIASTNHAQYIPDAFEIGEVNGVENDGCGMNVVGAIIGLRICWRVDRDETSIFKDVDRLSVGSS
jgi:hypothetical protein